MDINKLLDFFFPNRNSLIERQNQFEKEAYLNRLRDIEKQKEEVEKKYNEKCRDLTTLQHKTKKVSEKVTEEKGLVQQNDGYGNAIIKYRDGWMLCCDYECLPKQSVPELLVSDGIIVGAAQWDIHTRSFLKTFGSQTMRVPNPRYWRYMIPPPSKEDVPNYKGNKQSVSSLIAHTYNR